MGKFDNVQLNLELLAEEASEVIQAKSKLIRFGMNETNILRLNEEVGDFLTIVGILCENKILDARILWKRQEMKREKLKKFYEV